MPAGTGQGQRPHRARSRLLEDECAGLECGAGGADVIDQADCPAPQRWAGVAKSTLYVLLPLVCAQANLWRGVPGAAQRARIAGEPGATGQAVRQDGRLIVAPFALTLCVQWHGHEEIRGQGLLAPSHEQEFTERGAHGAQAVVFEAMDGPA